MKATSMFLELLVGGFGGLVWLSFLLVIVFGPEPLTYVLRSGSVNGALLLAMAVGASYVFGIVIDRIYIPIWRHVDESIRKKVGLTLNEYYEAQIVIAVRGNDRLNDLLSFYTSRMRILRSSMVNFFLASILGLWAFWPYKVTPWFLLTAGMILAAMSYIAFWQLTAKYYEKVVEAKKVTSDL